MNFGIHGHVPFGFSLSLLAILLGIFITLSVQDKKRKKLFTVLSIFTVIWIFLAVFFHYNFHKNT